MPPPGLVIFKTKKGPLKPPNDVIFKIDIRFLLNTLVLDSERDYVNIMCIDGEGEEEIIFITTTSYYKYKHTFIPLLNFIRM
jgi:hypothetical protein